VASRTTKAGRYQIAQWDLDHVASSDRWEVLRPDIRNCPLATEPLHLRPGTVVVWEMLDRVTRYRFPDGRRAENQFVRLTEELGAQLSMTFHRFLSGEARHGRRLALHLNSRQLEGWDPFARQESATVALPVQRLRLHHEGELYHVRVRPFVLPAEATFSSAAARRRAAGPGLWSRQQGFYFYRNDRLIQAGGWNRLRTQDEHSKLARIAVDIPSAADDAFELNVSKTQIRLPAPIRVDLAAIASSVCRVAEGTYRRPPRQGLQATGVTDERVAALQGLVRMVLGGAEEVIRDELSGSTAVAERLVARLREMELQFTSELSKRSPQ